jgi:DNA repair ATPase RecN
MPGDEELQRSHIAILATLSERVDGAHARIDQLEENNVTLRELTIGFTKLLGNVENITNNLTAIVKTLDRHEEKIEVMADKMETKDTVMKLYQKMDAEAKRHDEGMDAIMAKLRMNDEEFNAHKQEPAQAALAERKALRKWFFLLIGTIVTGYVLMYLGLR